MAEAAQARAKALFGFLDSPGLTQSEPTDTAIVPLLPDARKASDGLGSKDKAKVMVMTVKGAAMDAGSSSIGTAELNAGTIVGTGFATGTNQRVTHDGMTGTNKGPRRLLGTFNGASGIYSCAGACFSQRTDSGIILTGSGTWTFIANPGQKFDPVTMAEYGWWLNEGAATAPKAGAWHAKADGSAFALDATPIGDATGSAKYTGKATGQAAFYDTTTPGENVGGAFTANAELTATFGSAPMLEGEIKDFEIGTARPEWSVKLKKHPLTTASGALSASATTEWTVGTGDDAVKGAPDGKWNAQLHSIPAGGHQPAGVIGTFHAQHESEGNYIRGLTLPNPVPIFESSTGSDSKWPRHLAGISARDCR